MLPTTSESYPQKVDSKSLSTELRPGWSDGLEAGGERSIVARLEASFTCVE